MPFRKIDTKKMVNEKIETDQEFAKAYGEIKKEYDLIQPVTKDKKAISKESI
ncbi:hypothetical protein [Alkaliphilus oremlandii]|uniref:Uncharacterized protein n=1 Tax=Alkaliphilus oremlandii (strain OhILAs) TaxID=350688 RepID=A8MGB7_ALKOO|nr:hypothetical protein [Alkaliphilus oremlandii]ABW18845.1 hypothetical protein Clos_1300 [Alkaliphilus oremlandii OhILAs]